jgi:hypothetical protein
MERTDKLKEIYHILASWESLRGVERNSDYVKTLTPPRQNCYISRA